MSDVELPKLPEPGMQEINPYLDLGPMDPHKGKRLLVWFEADQMHAYGRQCYEAALEAAAAVAERYGENAIEMCDKGVISPSDAKHNFGSGQSIAAAIRAMKHSRAV